MRDNDNTRAYKLAAYHFASPEAGYGYADNEWIAGYVALRKLGDAELAVYHFPRFLAAVESHCMHICPTINWRSSAICMSLTSK